MRDVKIEATPLFLCAVIRAAAKPLCLLAIMLLLVMPANSEAEHSRRNSSSSNSQTPAPESQLWETVKQLTKDKQRLQDEAREAEQRHTEALSALKRKNDKVRHDLEIGRSGWALAACVSIPLLFLSIGFNVYPLLLRRHKTTDSEPDKSPEPPDVSSRIAELRSEVNQWPPSINANASSKEKREITAAAKTSKIEFLQEVNSIIKSIPVSVMPANERKSLEKRLKATSNIKGKPQESEFKTKFLEILTELENRYSTFQINEQPVTSPDEPVPAFGTGLYQGEPGNPVQNQPSAGTFAAGTQVSPAAAEPRHSDSSLYTAEPALNDPASQLPGQTDPLVSGAPQSAQTAADLNLSANQMAPAPPAVSAADNAPAPSAPSAASATEETLTQSQHAEPPSNEASWGRLNEERDRLPERWRQYVDALQQIKADLDAAENSVPESLLSSNGLSQLDSFVYAPPPTYGAVDAAGVSDRLDPHSLLCLVAAQTELHKRLNDAGLVAFLPQSGDAFDASRHHDTENDQIVGSDRAMHNCVYAARRMGYSYNGVVQRKATVIRYLYSSDTTLPARGSSSAAVQLTEKGRENQRDQAETDTAAAGSIGVGTAAPEWQGSAVDNQQAARSDNRNSGTGATNPDAGKPGEPIAGPNTSAESDSVLKTLIGMQGKK